MRPSGPGNGRKRLGIALAALLAANLMAACPCAADARSVSEAFLAQIEAARRASVPLRWDSALGEAAGLYARELLARNGLSHVDAGGGRVAERVGRQGCTDASLGEILGAGPGPREIVAAWMASPTHRDVLTGRTWTHVGVGTAEAGDVMVCVVVFACRLVEELRLVRDGLPLLRGRIVAPDAVQPVLLVDLDRLAPLDWSPGSGEFSFSFDPAWVGDRYIRLGYVSRGGAMRVTNVLRPGADPGAAGRSP